MKRKVVIYGSTLEKAIKQMNEIYNKEELIERTKDSIETENTIYKSVVAKESNRALKYNDAYVDRDISLGLYFDTIQYQMTSLEFGKERDGFIEFY